MGASNLFRGPIRCLGLPISLVVMLSGFPALAKDSWLKVTGPNVTAVSSAGKKKTRRLVREFEQFRAVFESAFPGVKVDSDCPLEIVAVKNKKQFRALRPDEWDEKESAGYFQKGPERNYIVLRTDIGSQAYRAVYHEYVHFLVSLNFEEVPLWLNEGLAEFWSHIQFRKKEVRIGLPAEEHLYHLNQHSFLPLAVLFSVDHGSSHYNDPTKTGIFYGQSWALTHLLMLADGVRQKNLLGQFTGLLNEGKGNEAYDEVFGDFAYWEELLRQYIGKRSYTYLNLSSPIKFEEDSLQANSLSQAQALAAQGYLMLQSRQTVEAIALLDRALELDRNEPTVWEGKGLAAFRQGDREAAFDCFTAAVKNNSVDYLSHYYLGSLGAESGIPDEEVVKAFRQAIRLNPYFARAYSELAYWYVSEDRNLKEALRLYRKTCNLEPRQLVHLDNVVRVLLRLEKWQEAEVLAKHLLRSARSDIYQEIAQSHLDVIETARNPMPIAEPVISSSMATAPESTSGDGWSESRPSLSRHSEQIESEQIVQTTSELSEQAHACRPYFVSVRGITPIPARLLSLECGDPVVFVVEIDGSLVRLTSTDPAQPALFSCDVKMEAVQCGSFEYSANVYFDPASEKDPSTGAMKVLAIEFKNP